MNAVILSIPSGTRHFSKKSLRNPQIRPHRIEDSLPVQTTCEWGNDAAIQQTLEFVSCITGQNKIDLFFQKGLRKLTDPPWTRVLKL